ncbi:MAG TPA: hypothetical protein VF159_01375 [Gemmatimonadaceae bacterium]
MKRIVVAAAVLVAAVALPLWILLPPAPARLPQAGWDDLASRTVTGAYHVHTIRSDGAADKAAVAAAASRAGLQFVILTDHGDGTRPPDPPVYLDGVLCLDAVEISTEGGHYVAIDMPRSPYPLGGQADAVAEDVRRLGGFGIAAHPDSPKPALQWTADDIQIDGVEWLNADSEWRDDKRGALARAAATYLLRPGPALASLLDRPSTSLARWDAMSRRHPVVGLAALDAHGGVRRRAEDGSRAEALGVPGYEASFRTFTNRLVLTAPLTGRAVEDAESIDAAIRAGRVFTTIDALAAPGMLDFHADAGLRRFEMGSELPAGADATIVARALAPAGARLVLLHDGREVASIAAPELRYEAHKAAGAFRVEVRLTTAPGDPPIPWLVGNPIYFLEPRAADVPTQTRPVVPAAPLEWSIEREPSSGAIMRTRDGVTELDYTIGNGGSAYAAAVAKLEGAEFSRITFHARADHPMRASIQLRFPDGSRWGRSVYVPVAGRWIDVPVDRMVPMDVGQNRTPDPSTATSLLVVVDLTNSSAGARGHLWFSEFRLQ